MSSRPRIKRRNPPSSIRKNKKHFRSDALPSLLADFGRRCAYCLSHSECVGGDNAFEIDHFRPTSKGGSYTNYQNLFLACRQCNKHKLNFWPDDDERKMRARFLNCTEESDYNELLFENSQSQIVPHLDSKPAIYHCRILKLNRIDLVKARLKRTALISKLKDREKLKQLNLTPEKVEELITDIVELTQLIECLIPQFLPPPSTRN
jgi:hypothetical protein